MVTAPAVAVKLAVVAPAGTVTDAGTVNAELLSDTVIGAPPDWAGRANVTVQDEVAAEAIDAGAQVSPETDCTELIVPPAPAIFELVPFGRTAITLVTGSDTTLPLAGALNVMFGVPWPLVSVPPVTVQVHCVAVGAFTLAALPAELAHAEAGALSAAAGGTQAATVTTLENSEVPSETVVQPASL